jgi:spore coat protein U-like protein
VSRHDARSGARSARLRLAGACAGALLTALAAPAARALVTSCSVSAGGVAFGVYNPLTVTPLDSTAVILVSCNVSQGRNSVTIALTPGASGTFGARKLVSGASFLRYNLYLDAAYTQIWGDGTGGSVTDTVRVTRRRPNTQATVYAQIPALQDVAPGSYADSITVTVNY